MTDRIAEPTIRPTRLGDEAFVLALGERAFAPFDRHARASMRAMLSDPESEGAVAEVDGARVGFIVVRLTRLPRPFGPWQRPAVARVDAIAVHPEAKRRGVGRGLMTWAELFALSRGACVLSLNTAIGNSPARRLFGACGFETLTRIGAIYDGGRAAIAMAKALDD